MSTGAATDETDPADGTLCRIDGLEVHYPIRTGLLQRVTSVVRAVDVVDLDVRRGETLALVGESGCGKSTLGRAVLGLERPTAGSATLRPAESGGSPSTERHARPAQVVFQDPVASLDPRWTVLSIVAEGLDVHRLVVKAGRVDRVVELLAEVELSADFLHKYPHELSGGQQQRVAIARALATRPELVVLDEATSALDVSVQAQILNLLTELQAELGLTYLFISHDLAVVGQFADRVAVMYLGQLIEVGPVAEVLSAPVHPYTQALLASALPLDPDNDFLDDVVVGGDVPSPQNPPSGCRFRTRCPHAMPECSELTYRAEEYATGHTVARCLFNEEHSP